MACHAMIDFLHAAALSIFLPDARRHDDCRFSPRYINTSEATPAVILRLIILFRCRRPAADIFFPPPPDVFHTILRRRRSPGLFRRHPRANILFFFFFYFHHTLSMPYFYALRFFFRCLRFTLLPCQRLRHAITLMMPVRCYAISPMPPPLAAAADFSSLRPMPALSPLSTPAFGCFAFAMLLRVRAPRFYYCLRHCCCRLLPIAPRLRHAVITLLIAARRALRAATASHQHLPRQPPPCAIELPCALLMPYARRCRASPLLMPAIFAVMAALRDDDEAFAARMPADAARGASAALQDFCCVPST